MVGAAVDEGLVVGDLVVGNLVVGDEDVGNTVGELVRACVGCIDGMLVPHPVQFGEYVGIPEGFLVGTFDDDDGRSYSWW